MQRRLFSSSWPPRLAGAVSVVVFVSVLAATPPGLGSLPVLLLTSARSGSGAAAAYAVAAAATLALAAMVLAVVLLAAVALCFRRRRFPRRPRGKRVQYQEEAAAPRAP